MLKNQPKCKKVFLCVDMAIATFAFFVSFSIVFYNVPLPAKPAILFGISHLALYALFVAATVTFLLENNAYKRHIIYDNRMHRISISKAYIFSGAVLAIVQMACNIVYFREFGLELLCWFILMSWPLSICARAFLSGRVLPFLHGRGLLTRKILIIGGGECAMKVAASLDADRHKEFKLVGFIDDGQRTDCRVLNELEVLGRFEDIGAVVGEKRVDELILALDLNQYDRIITILKECLRTKKVVRLHSNFLQVVTEKLKVEFYNRVPVIMLSQYALDDYAWSAKRLFDVLVSLIALVLLAPVFLFIAVGIKMSSKGPVIFRQERIGKKGKPFEFYKFRSMHMNGDDSKHKKFARTFILNSGELNQQGEQIFKIADDPRVFRFGKFIRKTSLDEFPQLVNVLKGDMTLVGPRPSLAYEWEVYKEWHKKRAEAPPGCTGLWQTAGRSSVTFEEMIILDLYYISNMTLLFDIKIMLQTFPVLLFGKGAY